nr:hypothetical protein [Tanacetum cinerariifolium]
VKDDIFDPEGDNVLPEKLLDLDFTKDLHPPHHVNPLSGSTTSSSSPNQLLEEFANELALIKFSPGNDELQFDIEFDLKEIEYLLYHDPIKDMDYILKDSIDQSNLVDLNNNLVNSMLEMFPDEHTLDYSSPPLYAEYDDDLFEVESDTEYDFYPPLYELPFFKEVHRSKILLLFSSKDEEKVFKPRIHTFGKVHSSLIPELSHQGYKQSTFSSHPILTSLEVKDDIFDPEGDNVLPEKLLDLDFTKDLHPPHHVNPLSGSTTSSSSPNQLLDEFADELALITFSPGNDELQFDIEFDLKEIEYLLHHDPIKDMDYILKDSIDQSNLVDLNDNLVDSMLEMFPDEHTLDYSSPPLYDEYDDDLFEVESDTEYVYDDPFDSKGEKIKEA